MSSLCWLSTFSRLTLGSKYRYTHTQTHTHTLKIPLLQVDLLCLSSISYHRATKRRKGLWWWHSIVCFALSTNKYQNKTNIRGQLVHWTTGPQSFLKHSMSKALVWARTLWPLHQTPKCSMDSVCKEVRLQRGNKLWCLPGCSGEAVTFLHWSYTLGCLTVRWCMML